MIYLWIALTLVSSPVMGAVGDPLEKKVVVLVSDSEALIKAPMSNDLLSLHKLSGIARFQKEDDLYLNGKKKFARPFEEAGYEVIWRFQVTPQQIASTFSDDKVHAIYLISHGGPRGQIGRNVLDPKTGRSSVEIIRPETFEKKVKTYGFSLFRAVLVKPVKPTIPL